MLSGDSVMQMNFENHIPSGNYIQGELGLVFGLKFFTNNSYTKPSNDHKDLIISNNVKAIYQNHLWVYVV